MSYIQITIQSLRDQAEPIAEALLAIDAISVSLLDGSDQPLFQLSPEDNPLWESVSIRALFTEDASPRDIIQQVKSMLELKETPIYKIEKLGDQDWVRLTQQHFQPQCHANKLWVYPSWHTDRAQDLPTVIIDPGLAFGTGNHETTALCLEWLASNNIKNKTVIDYGCGSGILSLAAAALGAAKVYAIDHDEQAIEATTNNLQLNKFAKQHTIQIGHSPLQPEVKADIIVANILSKPLIELADEISNHAASGATLILSGILNHEVVEVSKAYARQFTLQDIIEKNEWVLLTFNS